jgi:hypothetical protein
VGKRTKKSRDLVLGEKLWEWTDEQLKNYSIPT